MVLRSNGAWGTNWSISVCSGQVFFHSDTVMVTIVKAGLIVCGFELAGLDESS